MLAKLTPFLIALQKGHHLAGVAATGVKVDEHEGHVRLALQQMPRDGQQHAEGWSSPGAPCLG
jgi:hypothetical protein